MILGKLSVAGTCQVWNVNEVREQIFDFGFTTRGSTGFGLWWARNYLEMLGGRIECHQPVRASGARFVVRLPLDSAPYVAYPSAVLVGGMVDRPWRHPIRSIWPLAGNGHGDYRGGLSRLSRY